MSIAETADWVDGEALVRWLADDLHRIDLEHLKQFGDRWERLIRGCIYEGRTPNVYTVDALLCELGVCLGEMPEEFYVTEDPRAGKTANTLAVPRTTTERILRLRELGWTLREIAAMVGLTHSTVRRHCRSAASA